MIHSSQIITGSDLSIQWSATGSIASFTGLGIVLSYASSLQWQTKETIPVGSNFEETAKVTLKGTLNLTVLADKIFEMPEYVWIEIGLLIKELANGDRWMWTRTGKYLVVSDARNFKPDDTIEHQYAMTIQGSIVSELVLVPAAKQVFWKPSSTANLQASTNFGSSTFIKIL